MRVLIGSENGFLEEKGERGMVRVVVSGLGATEDEDEAEKEREKTKMRERRDEAAMGEFGGFSLVGSECEGGVL